jgi:hypothetical protein
VESSESSKLSKLITPSLSTPDLFLKELLHHINRDIIYLSKLFEKFARITICGLGVTMWNFMKQEHFFIFPLQ